MSIIKYLSRFWLLTLSFMVSILLPIRSVAQEDQEFEEITVFLMIQNVGGYEIDAIYMDEKIYVNAGLLFNILKINHTVSLGNDSITGFFLNEQTRYSINAKDHNARIGNNYHDLKPNEVFRSDMGLYLQNTVYGKIFGLNLDFNFRSLSLELKTEHELPIIKELRQEQMRKNINRLSGVVDVDTTYKREYHVLRGGMVDWSIVSTQTSGSRSDTRASLGIGTELLGGEATAILNYSSLQGFDERQQQYRWRWVNNESSLVKQVQAGKIPIRATSSLYAPVIGASISNSPTTFRRSFGSYTLTDYTEPGWTVELYINNVIVDFVTSDASGFFSFEVPLVYGSSQVTLRFYGPWGEERIKEQTINIPYNFIPAGSVEYNITGGVVRDTSNAIFSRAESMVGVHRNLTVGAGVEYLSSLKDREAMPFVTASARFLNNFLFTGEYTHGVKARGLLNYRLPSSLVFELDYTKYDPEQKAISFNYLEERKASLSIPIRIKNFRSFARASFRQNVLPQTTYSSAEVLLSSYISGVSTNISAYANWLPEGNPYMYSNIALGFRLGRSLNFRPQAQIDITNTQLISYRAELEKSFKQIAHLSIVYEDNIRSNTRSLEFSFRYDLPFAQTSASARVSNRNVMTTESARGTFAFGSGNGYVHTDNRSSVGRAGITINPFLDLNNNNTYDKGEPTASGLTVRLNGGRLINQKRDSLIRIVDLEPFASYLLELEDTGFENIAWQLKQKTISVQVDPNQFKNLEIPIKVMGEINGMVYLKKGRTTAGQGRIIINIFDKDGNIVRKIMTESDGYYNFLGLPPGQYLAKPDENQLKRLGIIAEPAELEFEITPDIFGDIIDDINFDLVPVANEEVSSFPSGKQGNEQRDTDSSLKDSSIKQQNNSSITQSLKDQVNQQNKDISLDKQESVQNINASIPSVIIPVNDIKVIKGTYDVQSGIFFAQAGAFKNRSNGSRMYNRVKKLMSIEPSLVKQNSLLKVRFGPFKTWAEAQAIVFELQLLGIKSFNGMEKIRY